MDRFESMKKAEMVKAFLEEHKVEDVKVVDLIDQVDWTDCFVVGTVTSLGHLYGVVRQLWDELKEIGLEPINRHKTPSDDGWVLIDCSTVVIHLMNEELRSFYNLEKLWESVEAERAK